MGVLLGRAWQHFFWDLPYRALLWDETLMRPLVEGVFGVSWGHFAANFPLDAFAVGIGVFFALGALLAAFPERFPARTRFFLPVLSGWLLFLAFLYSKEYKYQVGQFIEYALQVGAPLFLFWYWKKGGMSPGLERAMRWATALTFAGHGLYAVGYYPRPGHFTTMAVNGLGLPAETANQILFAAGVLDFVAALWLILPIPGRAIALWYCVVWGFATTMARPVTNFYAEFWASSLHQWVFEAVYRFPHFLIPLALIWPGRPRGAADRGE